MDESAGIESPGQVAQHYVAEIFWPGASPDMAEAALRRLRDACVGLSAAAEPIVFLSGTFVVEDEALICRFEGTAAAIHQAHAMAGLLPDRLLASRDLA